MKTQKDKWYHVSWRDRKGYHETQICAGNEKEAEQKIKELNRYWEPGKVNATYLFTN